MWVFIIQIVSTLTPLMRDSPSLHPPPPARHLLRTFSKILSLLYCPEVTLCGWQDGKIQLLTNFSFVFLFQWTLHQGWTLFQDQFLMDFYCDFKGFTVFRYLVINSWSSLKKKKRKKKGKKKNGYDSLHIPFNPCMWEKAATPVACQFDSGYLSLFLHPKKTVFVESACVLLFPCVSSHWWVHFPRSVLSGF